MYKIITMTKEDGSSIDVPFLANAATPFRYKAVFGRDLLVLFQTSFSNGAYDIDFVTELAYVMAMQAQGKSGGVDLNKISKDDMLIWLEQFDGFELVNKSKDIIEVYLGNSNISSKEKKKARKQSEN